MAYNSYALTKIADLNPVAGHAVTPTPGLFYYDAGADALATVVAAGYFNTDRKAFKGAAGTDLVMAVCSDGFRLLRVTAPATGNVTTAALLGAVS